MRLFSRFFFFFLIALTDQQKRTNNSYIMKIMFNRANKRIILSNFICFIAQKIQTRLNINSFSL